MRKSVINGGLFKHLMYCASLMLCMFLVLGQKVYAGNQVSIRFDAVVKDSALDRTMVDVVNDFRTGNEAWEYDQNGNKVVMNGLGKLEYDYCLELIAYKRAEEIAVYFSHTRPNGKGEDFRGAYNEYSFIHQYQMMGENILCGEETVQATVESFKETNCDYNGQGHRRNMLNPGFKAMGVAHIEVNGVHFWVQEFASSKSARDTYSNYKNNLLDIIMNVDSDYLGEFFLEPSYTSKRIKVGEKFNFPNIKAYVKNGITNELGIDLVNIPLFGYDYSSKYTITAEDPSIVTVNQYDAVGAKSGKTNVTFATTFNNKQYSVAIPVEVYSQITKITVDADEIAMNVGDTHQIGITLEPAGADSDLRIYQMNSKDVASISDTGLITALKPGKATFILSSKSNIFANNVWIFVKVNGKTDDDDKKKDDDSDSEYHHHSCTETFYLNGAKYRRVTNDDVTKVTYLTGPMYSAKVTIPKTVE